MPVNFNSVLEPTIYHQTMQVSADSRIRIRRKQFGRRATSAPRSTRRYLAQTTVTTTPTFLQQNLRGGDIAKMTDLQTAQSMTAASSDVLMQNVAKNLYAQMAEGF